MIESGDRGCCSVAEQVSRWCDQWKRLLSTGDVFTFLSPCGSIVEAIVELTSFRTFFESSNTVSLLKVQNFF